jgi:hypothetical protein
MEEVQLSRPLFAFAVGTRVALGIGIGLLVSERIPRDRRRAIGMTLIGAGVATTIPIAMRVFGQFSQRPEMAA